MCSQRMPAKKQHSQQSRSLRNEGCALLEIVASIIYTCCGTLSTQKVVFLSTPVVSLSFVHTRICERKQHRKESLLCQSKTTRPLFVVHLRKSTMAAWAQLMSTSPRTLSTMTQPIRKSPTA